MIGISQIGSRAFYKLGYIVAQFFFAIRLRHQRILALTGQV